VLDATTEAGGRAERRLREEQIAWLATVRSDGQPQSVPVWFFWDGEITCSSNRGLRQKSVSRSPREQEREHLSKTRDVRG
jgi:hypothetical protein